MKTLKIYQHPVVGITILESGVICEGNPMAASAGNHGKQITEGIGAPQRWTF